MARFHDITFDCEHPASLARFWAALVDGYEVAPYDDDEIARLASLGIHDLDDDPSVLVVGPSLPRMFFQHVPEKKTVKNRVHLDLFVDNVDAEIDRVTALGARVVADHRPEGGLVVLADPESNEFCLVPGD